MASRLGGDEAAGLDDEAAVAVEGDDLTARESEAESQGEGQAEAHVEAVEAGPLAA